MKDRQRMEAVWRERARRLAQLPISGAAAQDAWPVMVLGIGKERYGMDLPDVAEVLPAVRATPVPGALGAIAGVINVHGEIRPVIDVRRVLGMKTAGNGGESGVILLRKNGGEMGLQVDTVDQIRWIGSGDVRTASGGAGLSRYIKATTEDLLMILSTEALFAELDMRGTT